MSYDSAQSVQTSNTLGRATFHHTPERDDVRPINREIRWLKHTERHGPQSSVYLHSLTRDTHRCKDTCLRQLQKLRAAGFLRLPPQQRATERAEFNPYVYDLTRKAHDHLFDLDLTEPTIRPSGHWWHGYATACITSAIDIAGASAGLRYIPTHEILRPDNPSLAIPVATNKLIPDQLFAIDYGGSYRVFALEVDRGTEPKTSSSARKSYARSIRQYAQVIDNGLYRTQYGIRSPLLVLWVFNNRTNQRRFLELCGRHSALVQKSVLTMSWADMAYPKAVFPATVDWVRRTGEQMRIVT